MDFKKYDNWYFYTQISAQRACRNAWLKAYLKREKFRLSKRAEYAPFFIEFSTHINDCDEVRCSKRPILEAFQLPEDCNRKVMEYFNTLVKAENKFIDEQEFTRKGSYKLWSEKFPAHFLFHDVPLGLLTAMWLPDII